MPFVLLSYNPRKLMADSNAVCKGFPEKVANAFNRISDEELVPVQHVGLVPIPADYNATIQSDMHVIIVANHTAERAEARTNLETRLEDDLRALTEGRCEAHVSICLVNSEHSVPIHERVFGT